MEESNHMESQEKNPEETSNFFSRMLLMWVSPLITKGYFNVLMPEDLWPMKSTISAQHSYEEFTRVWNVDSNEDKQSVLRALRWNVRPFLYALILQFGYTCCNFGITLMLLWLIGSLSDVTTQEWLAWMYAAILVVLTFISAFCRTHAVLFMVNAVIGVRNSLMTSVYHKSTRLSSRALQTLSAGTLVNLLSMDSNQIVQVGRWLALGFIAPFDIIGVFIFLGFVIGPYACVLLAVFLFSLPLNGIVANSYFQSRKKCSPLSDTRLRSSNEFVKYIRAIKYYAWELFFMDRINKCREDEMRMMSKVINARSYLMQVSQGIGSVGLLLTLMAFVVGGNALTPAIVFTVFRLVQMLRMPFIMLPVCASSVLTLINSFKRLDDFLGLPERDPALVDRTIVDGKRGVVSIENGNLAWGDSPTLRDINVHFVPGKLNMVIGQVGSGKSSLLQAVLGDMESAQGTRIAVSGTVAYAAQTAFIVNDTLRNNVLFGKPYDEQLYQRALQASDLIADIRLLPGEDMTEIGERGINLSGGQKQRVSLARALYAQADVVLLDDSLSAVDAHVGEHIFRNAIQGMLAGRTVILVSNQLQYLPHAHYVVAMEDGRIREQGPYDELMRDGGDFSRLVASFGVHDEDAADQRKRAEKGESDLGRQAAMYKVQMENEERLRTEMKKSRDAEMKKSREGGVITGGSNNSSSGGANVDVVVATADTQRKIDADRALAGRLVIAEQMSNTSYVSPEIYLFYLKSGGWVVFVLYSFFIAASCAAVFVPGLWIGYWSVFYLGHGNDFYIGILALIAFGELSTYFVGSALSVLHGTRASLYLHEFYINKLAHATIAFYDSTPIGRITNRLAKDLDDIDSNLSFQLLQYVRNICQLCAIIGLIGYASPWLLLVMGPLAIVFWLYLRFYRRTAVRLQRIEAVTLSPIFQHFAETLPGLATIRAYDMAARECQKSNTYINADSLAEYSLRVVDTWLGIRLDFICAFCTAAVCFIMVGLRFVLNPIVAGFSINFSLAAVNILAFFSQNICQLETIMNSVERILMFGRDIPEEAPFEIPENKPPSDWPQRGGIEFDHVEFRYRPGLDLVLKGITFHVEGGEKVGIVGRTGAGKSSLLVILLRMTELSGGTIRIDGVDVSKIGLHDLRSKIGIIPQDPTLFSGTIRSNMDPFNQHTNDAIWDALRNAQLGEVVERDGGLEAPVAEDGANYSLGQRQLLCLARTLLRRPKILLMDEATASIDMENDALVQDTVRREFGSSTVLTIAHRLHTVADSDRILVLEKGSVAEYDQPESLVTREKSYFKSLVNATGASTSAHLTKFILHEKKMGKTIGSLLLSDEALLKQQKSSKNKLANGTRYFDDILSAFDSSSVPLSTLKADDKKKGKKKSNEGEGGNGGGGGDKKK